MITVWLFGVEVFVQLLIGILTWLVLRHFVHLGCSYICFWYHLILVCVKLIQSTLLYSVLFLEHLFLFLNQQVYLKDWWPIQTGLRLNPRILEAILVLGCDWHVLQDLMIVFLVSCFHVLTIRHYLIIFWYELLLIIIHH